IAKARTTKTPFAASGGAPPGRRGAFFAGRFLRREAAASMLVGPLGSLAAGSGGMTSAAGSGSASGAGGGAATAAASGSASGCGQANHVVAQAGQRTVRPPVPSAADLMVYAAA